MFALRVSAPHIDAYYTHMRNLIHTKRFACTPKQIYTLVVTCSATRPVLAGVFFYLFIYFLVRSFVRLLIVSIGLSATIRPSNVMIMRLTKIAIIWAQLSDRSHTHTHLHIHRYHSKNVSFCFCVVIITITISILYMLLLLLLFFIVLLLLFNCCYYYLVMFFVHQ